MAATTTYGNPDLMRKNLLKAVELYDKTPRRKFYDKLAGNVLTTDQLFEIAAQVGGIDLPTTVPEYRLIPSTQIEQVARKQYNYKVQKLQFRVSDDAFINDQYGIMRAYGTLLTGVFAQVKDILGAVFMNGCLSTALISTPMGQPLSSSAHPLEVGTDSNTFTVQQNLNVLSLQDATSALLNQKAHKGQPAPKFGPFQLEAATTNNHVAKQLIGAERLAQTNFNDPNTVAGNSNDDDMGAVTKAIINPYFVNFGWWGLRSIDNTQHNRFMLNRYGFKLQPIVYDSDNDSWKATAKEAYLFDVFDYRGTFYSTPS